jgi:methionyl aminopeptidase
VNYGGHIPLKSRHDIDRMRVASRHVAEILLEIRALAKPGVTTAELERASASSIERRGVISSFKGYGPHGLPAYPATMCMSVNEEIVHGIPGSRELLDGDILGLDFGVIHEGFHGDSAVTVPIGTVSEEALRLLDATRQALYQGIEQWAIPWSRTSWGTASGGASTSRPRSRTTGRPAGAPGCGRAWCSRSSRW